MVNIKRNKGEDYMIGGKNKVLYVLFEKQLSQVKLGFLRAIFDLERKDEKGFSLKNLFWVFVVSGVFFGFCITFDQCIHVPVLRNNFPFGSWADVQPGMWRPWVRGQG